MKSLSKERRRHYVIENTMNYDILSNPRYLDMFHYNHLDGRSEHGSSDMVAKLLYIGEDRVSANEERRKSINSELRSISWFSLKDKVAVHVRHEFEKFTNQ